MPCWQEISTAVDLGTCDRTTLIDALKDLGWHPTVNGDLISFNTQFGAAQIRDGAVIMRGSSANYAEQVRDTLKQAVMGKAIEKAGKKFGWNVTHDKQKNKIKLKRG